MASAMPNDATLQPQSASEVSSSRVHKAGRHGFSHAESRLQVTEASFSSAAKRIH